MRFKYIPQLLFVLMVLIHIVIPFQMIWERQMALDTGEIYYFRTEPVDPVDPFRGKYVALNYESDFWKTDTLCTLQRDDKVYVHLIKDSVGYASISSLSNEKPRSDDAYFTARVRYVSRHKDSLRINLRMPFDRFYMEESKAPKAEEVINVTDRTDTLPTYAVVKIHKGNAVLEDVKVNEVSLVEWVNLSEN